ncbi:WXG100 family type VII secretion target [Rhodococcus gannanensis]|uniref:ESAT-6-like protein n=1 Tax=Rhodococcus gannanensis TaxID=1960308 RepID=A0ABW4P7U2_9NOCA
MRVDPQRMHSTADRISVLAEEFWDDIEDLRKEVENLMSGDWLGVAAKSHARLWEEWVDSARRVAAALTNDAGLLHQAADEYTNTDKRNAGATSSLRLGIDS